MTQQQIKANFQITKLTDLTLRSRCELKANQRSAEYWEVGQFNKYERVGIPLRQENLTVPKQGFHSRTFFLPQKSDGRSGDDERQQLAIGVHAGQHDHPRRVHHGVPGAHLHRCQALARLHPVQLAAQGARQELERVRQALRDDRRRSAQDMQVGFAV